MLTLESIKFITHGSCPFWDFRGNGEVRWFGLKVIGYGFSNGSVEKLSFGDAILGPSDHGMGITK